MKRDQKKQHQAVAVITAVCLHAKVENNFKTNIGIGIFRFPKSPSKRKQWLKSLSRYNRREGADKFNVDNVLICDYYFKSGDINVSIGRGKKTLKHCSIPAFTDMKKHVSEGRRKPPAVWSSLIGNECHEEIEETSRLIKEQAPIPCEHCC